MYVAKLCTVHQVKLNIPLAETSFVPKNVKLYGEINFTLRKKALTGAVELLYIVKF
jgi:hypothetical protein